MSRQSAKLVEEADEAAEMARSLHLEVKAAAHDSSDKLLSVAWIAANIVLHAFSVPASFKQTYYSCDHFM